MLYGCECVPVCVWGTDVAAVVALGVISVAYGDTEWKMGAVRERERATEAEKKGERNYAGRQKEDGVDVAIKTEIDGGSCWWGGEDTRTEKQEQVKESTLFPKTGLKFSQQTRP